MQLNLLGKTGVKVSRVALGAMSFGGDADESVAWTIWRAARDAGVNLIDTADVYNEGRSEEFVGRFMRGERDQLVIASKAYFPTGPDANARGASRFHLMRAVERSLARLATDRIDLYYVHRFDDVTDLDQTLRALDDMVRAGKILYPACSNYAAWQIAHALGRQAMNGWAPLVATQPMYNLVKRQAEVEILPAAHALGIAVIPYSPTGGGLLTGKYGVGRAPDKGRLLDTTRYQTRYASPDYYKVAEAFRALAAELGHHPATLAVAWVASHPAVTSVLVGGRNPEQLAPSLAAAGVNLDEATRLRISALSPEPPPATDRNEEKTAHNYGSR